MELTLEDFADLFGVDPEDMPGECRDLIELYDFRYKVVDAEEREKLFLSVMNRIDSAEFSLAGPEGKARWEKGWGENLHAYVSSGHDPSSLVPKYIRAGQPLRLRQQYVIPEDPDFERNWYDVFRLWLFKRYLSGFDAIYEFGCGSGHNIAVLARLFPGAEVHGLDWTMPAKCIVDEMRVANGWNTHGHMFDFFSPDRSLKLGRNSALITVGALEQTGTNFEPFLQYELDCSPALVIHAEPIVEWYDPNDLIDYAAIKYHLARNYWKGYVGRLQELEKEGLVEILKMKRSFFGALHIEGYSQLIWKPTIS